MWQTYRQERASLLELTGYEIVNIYGRYHNESLDASAKNVIWCVRKKKQIAVSELLYYYGSIQLGCFYFTDTNIKTRSMP